MDQLTMDCIAAQKAGMSYGMWKALHPHTRVEPPKPEVAPVSEVPRYCLTCGELLSPYDHRNKLYCCPECSYEAKKARGREFYKRKKERVMANG